MGREEGLRQHPDVPRVLRKALALERGDLVEVFIPPKPHGHFRISSAEDFLRYNAASSAASARSSFFASTARSSPQAHIGNRCFLPAERKRLMGIGQEGVCKLRRLLSRPVSGRNGDGPILFIGAGIHRAVARVHEGEHGRIFYTICDAVERGDGEHLLPRGKGEALDGRNADADARKRPRSHDDREKVAPPPPSSARARAPRRSPP